MSTSMRICPMLPVWCSMCSHVTGTARTEAAKSWPWIVEKDNQLVVLVGLDEGEKKPKVMAEVCCHAAQSLGGTSLNLIEHTMTLQVEALL